jgi:diguanylate cyclase (GGDEF)-like protein/PAS domain S-box-containing protein
MRISVVILAVLASGNLAAAGLEPGLEGVAGWLGPLSAVALAAGAGFLLGRRARRGGTPRPTEAPSAGLLAASFEAAAVYEGGRIVEASPLLGQMLGCPPEALVGASVLSLLAEESRAEAEQVLRTPLSQSLKVLAQRGDGSRFPAELQVAQWPGAAGGRGVLALRESGTAAPERQQVLEEENRRLRVTLEAVYEGIITTDRTGRLTYLNAIAQHLTGWAQEEALGRPVDEVLYLADEAGRRLPGPARVVLQQASGVSGEGEHVLRHRDGQDYAVEYTAEPVYDARGEVGAVVVILRDLSALRGMSLQLSYQASHDALTGLINRQEFQKRLGQALAEARSYPRQEHALCYLDLDQFKVVNDTCGHAAGDEMIKQLASLLHARLREHDVLARLGGDEFGILLRDCSVANAEEVTDSLRRTVREFRFVWEGRTFDVGASAGLVAVNAESPGVAELLSAADAACYVAKAQGRNRVQRYQPDDIALARHEVELHWVQRISRAVEQDRLVLYGQPIVPLGDEPQGPRFEVLVRMLADDGDLVPPTAFSPAGERYNVMHAVDRWVLKATLAVMAEDPRGRQPGQLACSVNLSGQSIDAPGFTDYVLEQLHEHGIPAQNLCFEITETAAIENFSGAQEFVRHFRDMGCSFALDDFGSGFSSYGYLKRLAVDYLKIDGSFIRDMVDDAIDYAMVESINQLGHVMGIRTIAEYVENEAIRDLLRGMGVDFAQGLAVGPIEPLAQLLSGPARGIS